jgi:hypothetical protein
MDGITAEELLAFVRGQRSKRRRNHAAALSLLEQAAAEIQRLDLALEHSVSGGSPSPVDLALVADRHIDALRREADALRTLVDRLEGLRTNEVDLRRAPAAVGLGDDLDEIFPDRTNEVHLQEVDTDTIRHIFDHAESNGSTAGPPGGTV